MTTSTYPFLLSDLASLVAARALTLAGGKASDAYLKIGEAIQETALLNDPTTAAAIIAQCPDAMALDRVPTKKNGELAPKEQSIKSVQRVLGLIAFYAILNPVKAQITIQAMESEKQRKERIKQGERLAEKMGQ